MHLTQTPIAPSPRRALAGLAALALVAAIAVLIARNGTGWWQLFAFGAAPDLALLLGVSRGLAPGQLHPRAVPAYNLLHRPWGPALLGAAALAGLGGPGLAVAALAWGLHIAVDGLAGYGLRDADGFQRS
jgi:hypothetical protein